MQFITSCILLSLVFISASCMRATESSACEKHGVAFNLEREKRGLISLDTHWRLTEKGRECIWKSEGKSLYAEKRLSLNAAGKPKTEKDIYVLRSAHGSGQRTAKIWFEYDYVQNKLTSYTHGSLEDEPYYDVRSSIADRQIDYLHYFLRIPWYQLPKTDTLHFPLLITDTIGNTIERADLPQ